MSYGEVLDQARNAMRRVAGFARASCATVMNEDQFAPKRCGHTQGKSVISRLDAVQRIRAAVDLSRSEAPLSQAGCPSHVLASPTHEHVP